MSKSKSIFRKFSKNFWVANSMELFERWAWYGMYNALALYLTNSKGDGGLEFTTGEMGIIVGTGSMLLYFLPTITGSLSDKFGFKKTLIVSFFMYITGFLMMAYFESFAAVFLSYIYVAIGGALFKPIIAATVAKTTTKETSSVGFGIFYMMVNIGGWIGPLIAGIVKAISWNYVFAISMGVIGINYIIVFALYKEPDKEKNTFSVKENIITAFKNLKVPLSNYKYLIFLIIMIGFWTVFNQLYYTFTIYLEQWCDTNTIYNGIHSILPGLARLIGTESGSIDAVTMTSFDAFYIVLFQILVSYFVMRFKPLNAMIGGIIVLSIGVGIMFATQNGWYLLLGMLIFSLGEMSSSPKFTEYVGRIAPSDKVALYIGTSYLPLAAAHQLSGVLAGQVYGKMSDKLVLLKTEVAKRSLEIPEISKSFSQENYYEKAGELMGLDQGQLTQFLYETYNPSRVWVIYTCIGLGTALALLLYDKFILKSKNDVKAKG